MTARKHMLLGNRADLTGSPSMKTANHRGESLGKERESILQSSEMFASTETFTQTP